MQAKDQILARMYVVITLVSLVPILVGFQILKVSILEGPELRESSQVQSIRYEKIPSIRGSIMDVELRPMAVNIEHYDLRVDPTAPRYAELSAVFFERLSEITGKSPSSLKREVGRHPGNRFITLARGVNVSRDDIAYLETLPFAIIDRKPKRQYIYDEVAAHILGFVGTDGGLAGIEKEFDQILSGREGRREVVNVGRGRIRAIPGGIVQRPEDGASIVLTIDLFQQAILEEELRRGVLEAGATWGTAVALDVNTGAVIAMANYPTFNPNDGGVYTDARRNHAISDRMEPGSTLKVLTAVAAIETGAVTMDEMIDTGDGYLRHSGWDLRDTHPHGTIPFREVIKVSSNIGAALVSDRIDKDKLYQFARNLGFNQQTNIELPGEVITSVKLRSQWSKSTPSAMSRGYEIEVSPLQIALAYAALANGGVLLRPHIVKEIRDARGHIIDRTRVDSVRRAFSQETARKITPGFEDVVGEGGTAPEAAIRGLRIAGKTGTAKMTVNSRYSDQNYRATFVGFFPVEDPRVVLLVLMESPRKSIYGGIVSAPVFKRTVERWIPGMESIAQYVSGDSGKSSEDIGQDLSISMIEAPAISARSMAAQDTSRVMPDLSGLALRDAVAWLSKMGVRTRHKGHGMVQEQWPDPGSVLPEAASLSLN